MPIARRPLLIGILALGLGISFPTMQIVAQNAPLRIGVQSKLDSYGPQGGSQWALIEYGVAETLTLAGSDGAVNGWLAESVTSPDGKVWTVKLRDGVKFQNGKPMTADVVAKALDENRTKNPEGNFMSTAKIAATGPLEVKIELSEPSAFVPAALAGRYYFPIYDVSALPADQKDFKAVADAKVYTGPFMPVAAPGETSISLVANPSYWRGEVPRKNLELVVIPSAETRISALEAGDIQVATEPPASTALRLKDDGPVRLATNPKAAGFTEALITHVLEGPMQDARVRRAIGYAIDYQTLAKEVLNGAYLPANGLYGPSIAANNVNYVYDPAKANELLTAAGWELKDGKRYKDGAELQLNYMTGSDDSDGTNIGVALKQMLATVGINLEIKTVADVYAPESFGTWHILVRPTHAYGINGSPIDALGYSIGAQWGLGGQKDEEVALLSKKAEMTINDADRNAILAQLQDRVLQEGLLYSLGFQPTRVGVTAELGNYVPVMSPMIQWDIGKPAQ
jgi:peptide/nickel transport system substrate-binding protein